MRVCSISRSCALLIGGTVILFLGAEPARGRSGWVPRQLRPYRPGFRQRTFGFRECAFGILDTTRCSTEL